MSRKLKKWSKEDNIRRADLFFFTFNNFILPIYIKIGWKKLKVYKAQSENISPIRTGAFSVNVGSMVRLIAEWLSRSVWTAGETPTTGIALGRRNALIVMSSIHPSLRSAFIADLKKRLATLSTKRKWVIARQKRKQQTDKFIPPELTYAEITRPHNKRQPGTDTNKIAQLQVSSGKSTLNNAANTSKPASPSSCSNISSNVQKRHISGIQTQTEMHNVAITVYNANKLANRNNTINISGNLTTDQAKCPTQAESNNVANKRSKVEETEKRKNANSGENTHKRSVQEAELKQESITTIVNFHANEKKTSARDPINILKDAEQVARGPFEKWILSSSRRPAVPSSPLPSLMFLRNRYSPPLNRSRSPTKIAE